MQQGLDQGLIKREGMQCNSHSATYSIDSEIKKCHSKHSNTKIWTFSFTGDVYKPYNTVAINSNTIVSCMPSLPISPCLDLVH